MGKLDTYLEPGFEASASSRLVRPLSPLLRRRKRFSSIHVGSLYERSSYSSVDCPDLMSRSLSCTVLRCSLNEYVETWTPSATLRSCACLRPYCWIQTVKRAFSPVELGTAADLRGAERSTSGVNFVAMIVMVEGQLLGVCARSREVEGVSATPVAPRGSRDLTLGRLVVLDGRK